MTSNYAQQINEILASLSASSADNEAYGVVAQSTDDPDIVLVSDIDTAVTCEGASTFASLQQVTAINWGGRPHWTHESQGAAMHPVWDAIVKCQVR